MSWVLLGLGVAFFDSLKDVFSKKSLLSLDEFWVTWALGVFAAPFVLPFVNLAGCREIGWSYFGALSLSSTLNAAAFICFLRAMRSSDLSYVVPFSAFIPVFQLGVAFVLLGEFPTAAGLVGVFLIVLGSYVLNLQEFSQGLFEPLKALITNPGPRLAVLAAFFWSISSTVDKIGLSYVTPTLWAATLLAGIAVVTTPFLVFRRNKDAKKLISHWRVLFLVGLCTAAAYLLQLKAIMLTLVVYITSLRRLSILFSIIWGKFVFKEKNIQARFTAAMMMLAGVLLIVMWQPS